MRRAALLSRRAAGHLTGCTTPGNRPVMPRRTAGREEHSRNGSSTVNSWRQVLAALANEKLRIVFAELVLDDARRRGIVVSEPKRTKALDQLAAAGLAVREDGWSPNPSIFRTLLEASGGAGRREGVERFLVAGRIDQYPANKRQRYELLRWIAGKAFTPGEELSEKDVNERLGRYTSDAVTLRRYLVDSELLERTRTGSAYSPVTDGSGGS